MLKLYIANLGKYNEGELVGKWVNLPCEELGQVLEEIEVIEGTAYEEYAIHDYESDIDGLEVGEYESIWELNDLAEQLESLDDTQLEHLKAYMEAQGTALAYALENFEDTNFYQGMSLIDLAYELVDEGCFGDVADGLKNYIDYEAIAKDLGYDGYTETAYGVIF